MLEVILFTVPRCDTKQRARDLLARFGSFARVIAAPVPDLLAVDGVGEAAAVMLKLVHAAAVRLISAEVVGKPVLSNWDRLMAYLNAELRASWWSSSACSISTIGTGCWRMRRSSAAP